MQLEPTNDYHEVCCEAISTVGGYIGMNGGRNNIKKKRDLPDEIENRVNLTLLPNPNADSLKRESASSPTLLLAGIIYYQIKKNLGGGCTQIVITSKFRLKPKIIALCLMGKKYRGGKDTKKGTKWKALDSPVASTSNQ